MIAGGLIVLSATTKAGGQSGAARQRPVKGRERVHRETLPLSETLRLIPDGGTTRRQRRSFENRRQKKGRIKREAHEAVGSMREIKRHPQPMRQQMRSQTVISSEVLRLTRRLARRSLEINRLRRLKSKQAGVTAAVRSRFAGEDFRRQEGAGGRTGD